MKLLVGFVLALVLVALGAAAWVWSGTYNVAADDPHSEFVHELLTDLRRNSIASHSAGIQVPDLDDPALVRSGAGNYDAMCVQCHLKPGMGSTELSRGLYPPPPELPDHGIGDPAQAFWVIKHGIKASGMPAWGPSMEDRYIWGMVAFLRKLPQMDSAQYAAEVAASGGHSHGGGESEAGGGHSHGNDGGHDTDAPGAEGHHHDTTADTGASPGAHHPHGPADTSTPVATAQALHQALASGEAGHVEALLDPDVLILESGGAERSRAEYAAHHMKSDMAFIGSASYALLEQTGDASGDMAWVASEARIEGTAGGKPMAVRSAETLVLRREADGWRVVHVHWSSQPLRR